MSPRRDAPAQADGQAEAARQLTRARFERLTPCDECPFVPGGFTISEASMADIQASIRTGRQFLCRKTTGLPQEAWGDITARRGCAGARDWAREQGCPNIITRFFDAQDDAEANAY